MSDSASPNQFSIRSEFPTASNHQVAMKVFYQNTIEMLVKEGDIKEGELVIEEKENGELFLKCTSERTIEEIMRKAFPEKFEKPFSAGTASNGLNLKYAEAERPKNRAERRAAKKRRR